MKLTRRQKNSIDKLSGVSPEEIAKILGLETSIVHDYLRKPEVYENSIPVATDRAQISMSGISLKNLFSGFLRKNKSGVLIILFLGFVIYTSSLANLPVSDDKPLMEILKSGGYLAANLKEPVNAIINSLTYTINYLTDGTNPIGYHLGNVVLHLLVSLVIYFFLYLVTTRRVAFLAALIFSVATIHSEPVIWISGRHYVLYSLFAILALISYVYYTENKDRPAYYFCAIILFVASVYSFPEQAIVTPLLLPLIDMHRDNLRKNLKYYVVFFSLSALFAWLSLHRVQDRVASVAGDSLTSKNYGWGFIITDASAIYHYLKLFIIPFGLSFYHEAVSTVRLNLLAYFSVCLAFLSLPIIFFKKNRLVLFAVGFFVITLLPTLTPLKVSWAVAERYAYLGILGPALLLALVFDWLLNKKSLGRAALASLVLLIAFWSTMTFLRGFDWKDEDSLWLATVKTSPDSSKAWNNMGDYYGRHGDMQASFNAFVKATQINPSYSDAWHNAGNALVQMGKDNESIPYFEKSLQFNPNLIEAYNNLAVVYHKKGDQEKSLAMINKSLQINPQTVKTYMILALIEYENKNVEKSIAAIQKGLTIDPTNEVLQKNLKLLEQIKPQPLPVLSTPTAP